jgi:type I restriction enzyme, S subunit
MIPEGWEKKRLGKVAYLQRGFDLPNRNRVDGSIPIISSSGISGYHNEIQVKAPGVVTGRYGTIGNVFYIEEDYWPLNTSLWVKDFYENDPKYIYYLLSNIDYKKFSDKTGVPGVNRNDLHSIKISIPSTNEQKKIAKILSTWDQTISVTEKLIENSKAQKQALMQLLLSNKKWATVKFSDVLKIKGGNAFKSENFSATGIPIIRISNIKNDYSISTKSCIYHKENLSLSPFKIKKGDILIAMSGATTGKVGRHKGDSFYYLNQRVGRFDIKNNKAETDFIFQLLKLPHIQHKILIDAIGGAQPNISNKDIERIIILLPSIKEQQKIASILSAADKEIELLQQKYDFLIQEKKALMQQLLTGKRRVKVD